MYASARWSPRPDEVAPALYAGSRLGSGLEAPPGSAYDGLAQPVAEDLAPAEAGPQDREIAEAIAGEAEWMTAFLARLVDQPTVLGHEEPGQAVVREALREVGLDPVDVPDGSRGPAGPSARIALRLGSRPGRPTWSPPGTAEPGTGDVP